MPKESAKCQSDHGNRELAAGDPRTALAAIREVRGNLELLAKMLIAAETAKPEEESSKLNVDEVLEDLRLFQAIKAVGRGEPGSAVLPASEPEAEPIDLIALTRRGGP